MKANELPESIRARVLEALPPSQHDWEITPDEVFEALLNDIGIYGFGRQIASDFRAAYGEKE